MRFRDTAISGIVVLFLCACDVPEPPAATETPAIPAPAPVKLDEGIAASYQSGNITMERIEQDFAMARTPACMATKRSPGGGSVDELIPCYREIAEAIAIEEIVLAGIDDREQALDALDDNYIEQRNAILLNSWSRQEAENIEVPDAEVELFFDEHSDELRTPRRFTLYNIFRRDRDTAKPEESIAFLLDLKSRINAGETFGSIARQYSDSETRLRDGLVGGMSEEQLPLRLREITSGLKNGELSEPVRVSGGAILIKIEGATQATEPDLERSRNAIVRRLTDEKLRATLEARIGGQDIPAGSLVYPDDELLGQLDADDHYQLVFDLGGQQLTIAEFRNMAGLQVTDVAADLPEDRREIVLGLYHQLRDRRLLLIDLLASDEPAIIELREQVEQPLQKERLTSLVDKELQTDMWQSVDGKAEALERFFNDNSHHYQSPLRFKLQVWNLPFDEYPAKQLTSMEQTRVKLEQGEISLARAAEDLGGSIEDLGWREFSELTDLPRKAQGYLLQAGKGRFSIPYQQDDTLHMIWIEDREEPVGLDYAEVRERVREDYYARFERKLYLEAVEQQLDLARFTFSEENVQRWLLPAQ